MPLRPVAALCRRLAVTGVLPALLAACGGGGGAGTDAAAPAPVLPPEVAASLSAGRVALGASATLSWTSERATSCSVAEATDAPLPPSGSLSVTPAAGGRHAYTLRCDGQGGQTSRALALVVPMPVFATSYENKNAIAFDETRMPAVRALGVPRVVATEQESIDRSIAFADFFQEGAYSAFVMTSNSDGRYGADRPGNLPGVGYFLARDANGRWVDRSAELFRSAKDRMGCISPSYSAVADFNHDGRPDVHVACTGFDFLVPGATEEENQAYGRSYQIIVLSQPDGSYVSKRLEEDRPLYGHKAVAFDINGDGHVDVVTTDFIDPAQPNGCGAPYVLLGRGDGSFTRDYRRIDGNALRSRTRWSCGMFNVDMVPVDGRHDLVFGGLTDDGSPDGAWVALWVKATAAGYDFAGATPIVMPIEPTSGRRTQLPLDMVYDAQTGHFLFKTTATRPDGEVWTIVRADRTGAATVLDSWFNPTVGLQPTSPQFKPSHDRPGVLVPYTGGCAPDLTLGDCGRTVRVR